MKNQGLKRLIKNIRPGQSEEALGIEVHLVHEEERLKLDYESCMVFDSKEQSQMHTDTPYYVIKMDSDEHFIVSKCSSIDPNNLKMSIFYPPKDDVDDHKLIEKYKKLRNRLESRSFSYSLESKTKYKSLATIISAVSKKVDDEISRTEDLIAMSIVNELKDGSNESDIYDSLNFDAFNNLIKNK